MNTKATPCRDNRNKASKLVLEAVGPDDIEFLTCLAAAFAHGRCIRVFKTEDAMGKHYEYYPAAAFDDGQMGVDYGSSE